jgi:YD repeat-containing protein
MKEIKKNNSYLIIVTMLLILSGCKKETIKVNDLGNLNLKGNVKSIKETNYESIEKFGKITKGKRGSEILNCALDYILDFNIEGNIVEEKKYFSNGELGFKRTIKYDRNIKEETENDFSNSTIGINTYKYDDKKNVLEHKINSRFGEVIHKYSYKYDSNGLLIATHNEDGKIEENYKYDNNEKLTENYRFDIYGQTTRKFTLKYYNNGNVKETEELLYYDGVIYSQQIYKCNSNGKVTLYIKTNKGNLVSKKTYKYDIKGNMTEMNEYRADDNNRETVEVLYCTERYKYDSQDNRIEIITMFNDGSGSIKKFKFDNKNNWIECIEFDGVLPKYIIERKIEYYE